MDTQAQTDRQTGKQITRPSSKQALCKQHVDMLWYIAANSSCTELSAVACKQAADRQQGVFLMVKPEGSQQLLHHGSHDSVEASAAHHGQHLVLWAVWVPHLNHMTPPAALLHASCGLMDEWTDRQTESTNRKDAGSPAAQADKLVLRKSISALLLLQALSCEVHLAPRTAQQSIQPASSSQSSKSTHHSGKQADTESTPTQQYSQTYQKYCNVPIFLVLLNMLCFTLSQKTRVAHTIGMALLMASQKGLFLMHVVPYRMLLSCEFDLPAAPSCQQKSLMHCSCRDGNPPPSQAHKQPFFLGWPAAVKAVSLYFINSLIHGRQLRQHM